MRWPIRYQLIATYLLVSLLTAGVTYTLVYYTSEQRINKLALKHQTNEMKREVTAWFQTEKSWLGFQEYFETLHPPIFHREPESGGVKLADAPPHLKSARHPKRHGLVTMENMALVPYLEFVVGDYIAPAFLMDAIPIYDQKQQIAWIIPPESTGLSLSSQLKVFLDNIHQILFFAVAIGVIVSLLFGVILSRWLLKPMFLLHDAMSSMAAGRLHQNVPVTAQNELGELAKGFNQMSQSLADADQKKRQLTADITHDLSTPVQVISGYVELAQQGALPLDKERLNVVEAELMLIQRLIKDMNLLAKTDNQGLAMYLSEVSIEALMGQIHRRFLPKCLAERIVLNLDTSQSLPTLQLDESRMLQVLGNLMDNAIRHTDSGGEISLSARVLNEQCEIVVNDSGSGIAPEVLPHIFDRFYRAEDARTSVEGNSGLGLSICKGLLEMQGASIEAKSDGKSGSCFTIRLPIIRKRA